MITLLTIINLTIMAAVFGYAVAASTVGHPAMLAISRRAAVEYFKPFFHKSARSQLKLSIIVLVLSVLLSFLTTRSLWAIGAIVLQLSGPYTIKILMPVNNRIMDKNADPESEQMAQDLKKWGKLHLPRTILAGAVFVLFAYLAAT